MLVEAESGLSIDRGPETHEAPRRGRRWRRRAFLLAILLVLLWSGYWFAAYSMADLAVSPAEAAEPEGAAIACSERRVGGFPLALTISCRAAQVASADGLSLSIEDITARAPLYNPGRVAVAAAGPLALSASDFSMSAAWASADATVEAGLSGISAAAAAFAGVTLDVEDGGGARLWSAAADRWSTEIRPAADQEDALRVVLSAQDLVLTLSTGVFPALSGEVTLTMQGSGDDLNADPLETARRWLGGGGRFDIDDMSLRSGSVVAEVTGPMTLEYDGTFSGDLTVRYRGEEDLPLLVAALFPSYADEADAIAAAVVALSRPIEMTGEPGFEVPLTLRHGAVSVGLIPILTIPSMGSLESFR